MAPGGATQLTTLCATASFLWLIHGLEGHRSADELRLSSLLILLMAAIVSFALSFFSQRLPGAKGRFDDDLARPRVPEASADLPHQPRRHLVPGLVGCVAVRLEIVTRVARDFQCSAPGIEAFLPLLVLFLQLLSAPRARPTSVEKVGRVEDDDWGQTVMDSLSDWFLGLRDDFFASRWPLILGSTLLSIGAYMTSSPTTRSTYFCSSNDNRSMVISLQCSGLFLDGTIIILLWRILARVRTTRLRLRTLSRLLLASAASILFICLLTPLSRLAEPPASLLREINSLYLSDVFADAAAFSLFLITSSIVLCEESPLTLVSILTFVSALMATPRRIRLIGTWETDDSPRTTLLAFVLVCSGIPWLAYAKGSRSVLFVRRAWLVLLLLILVITASIVTFTRARRSRPMARHPLDAMIYAARVETGRWIVHAKASGSLPVAVQEYRKRHHGRDPFPNFDVWYRFAMERESPIMDHFPQIETDILPFWGIPPAKIREDSVKVGQESDMAMLRIQDGSPAHDLPAHSPDREVIDDFVAMLKTFAKHLPDMNLVVNLRERPRVLAPWSDVHRLTEAGKQQARSKLLSRDVHALTQPSLLTPSLQTNATESHMSKKKEITSARDFRDMTALSCPPGTSTRSGVHWNVRDFCSSCASRHCERGPHLTNRPLSLDICHQSDLLRLHGFQVTRPQISLFPALLPVFGRSKMDNYADILIPLSQSGKSAEDGSGDFDTKRSKLFWREKPSDDANHELLHGGHRERLVHMVNNASLSDLTVIALPTAKDEQYTYEHVPTTMLNDVLAMDIAFTDTCLSDSTCVSGARREFGAKPDDGTEILLHQYVLVADSDTGPPPDLLRVVRSGSVPFYASIFREWYSERLLPWVHYIPVDLRWHALHGTLAYFLGLPNMRLAGREIEMSPRVDDGRWIAGQGKRWAGKALRREDAEVYLFRLLLEWGRVLSDDREKLGFVMR